MTAEGRNKQYTDRLAEYTDEQLVTLCRDSSISVQYSSELIYRYYGFIKSKASLLSISPAFYDDFVQEGLLGLISAVKNFDESRNVRFSSYAYVCVINNMRSAAKKLSSFISDKDDSEGEQGEDTKNPESIIIQRETFEEMCDVLTEFEYDIFMMFIKGLSYDEIAAKLNISQKSANNAVQRARRKLRAKYDCSK